MFIKNGSFKKYTHIISYVPPYIVQEPTGGIVRYNDTFTFTVIAKGNKPLIYKWYKNNYPIPDSNSNTLVLLSAQASDQAEYYCRIQNNTYIIETRVVGLNVLSPPVFTQQPSTIYAYPLDTINFSVSTTGSPIINYQWYKNSEKYPSISDNLYINNVHTFDIGDYFVVASNEIGSVTSNSVSLNIFEPIIITKNPVNLTVNYGASGNLYINYTGTFPVTAQWKKDNLLYRDTIIDSSNTINLNIDTIKLSDNGYYNCVLSNLVNTVTSTKALIYVNSPVEITLQPPITSIAHLEETSTITIESTGTNPISYKWLKQNYGIISNATTKVLTFQNTKQSDEGYYFCIASNIVNAVTSITVQLSVIPNFYFKYNPISYLVDFGETVTFSVSAIGPEPFTYIWLKDNVQLPDAIGKDLYVLYVDPNDEGSYSCIVTSRIGSITSLNAYLSVTSDVILLSDGSYLTLDGINYIVL